MELRKPHIQRQKRSLQELLRRPGVPASEKEWAKKVLSQLGKPKNYGSEAPQPGALDPGPMPVVNTEIVISDTSFENLSSMSHSQLYRFAQQHDMDVSSSDTKATIIKKIMASVQGENP